MTNRPNYNVIIAGGREFLDYKLLSKLCSLFLCKKATTHNIRIFTGKAISGADPLGEHWGWSQGYAIVPFPAHWSHVGKAAGMYRNEAMAMEGHCLIAFWDGQSKGTKNMIEMAKRHNLVYRIILYREGYILFGEGGKAEMRVSFRVFEGGHVQNW